MDYGHPCAYLKDMKKAMFICGNYKIDRSMRGYFSSSWPLPCWIAAYAHNMPFLYTYISNKRSAWRACHVCLPNVLRSHYSGRLPIIYTPYQLWCSGSLHPLCSLYSPCEIWIKGPVWMLKAILDSLKRNRCLALPHSTHKASFNVTREGSHAKEWRPKPLDIMETVNI